MTDPNDFAGSDESVAETEHLQHANRDLQDQVAALRRDLEAARSSERLLRESRWWRLGLALRNRRNILFALRHPMWAIRTLLGFVRRRGRARSGRAAPARTARAWLAGVSAEPRDPRDLWIAGIVSDDLRSMVEPDCHLITFRPDNWDVTLESRRPHMLLVESTTRGNDGSWEYRIGAAPHADSAGVQDLRELVGWCRANGTQTVFWYTLGPSDAESFVEAASLFDHVIATERDAALRLQRAPELHSHQVLVVPLGVQPATNSPVGASLAPSTCAIAPIVPSAESTALIAAAQATGLRVYTLPGDEVPPELLPHAVVVEARALERCVAAHAVYLNTDPRGLPVRVLNALASGAGVVSVPNQTLENALGSVVSFPRTTEDGKEAIEQLLAGSPRSAAGLGAVLAEHTVAHRIAAIARAAGFDVDEGAETRFTAIALAADAGHGALLTRGFEEAGLWAGEVLVGVPGAIPVEEADPSPSIVRLVPLDPHSSSSEQVQTLARMAAQPWLALLEGVSDADRIAELLRAKRFANADVIGVGEDYAFAAGVDLECAVARRDVVAARGWPPEPHWSREGVRIFTVPR